MAQLYHYGGTTYALTNGIGLNSIGPVPIGVGTGLNSTQRNGLQLQYGQTKRATVNNDDVIVLYLGRQFPTAETSGQVNFDTFDLAYTWNATTMLATDGTTAIETAIRAIMADQRSGYMCQMQTSQGHNPAGAYSLSYPALYGRLSQPIFEYRVDQPGWISVTMTFTEVR